MVIALLRALCADPLRSPGRTQNPPPALAKDDHE